jgi:membrane protein
VIRQAGRLAWRAAWRFLGHDGPDRAAAVAYYTLLSLLPFVIFVISVGVAVVGSFDDAYEGAMFALRGVVVHLDQAALEALRLFAERATRLQWPGILLLAWTSRRIFASLFSALEVVFEHPGRGIFRGNLASLAMMLVSGLGLITTMAATMLLATTEGLLLRHTHGLGARAVHSAAGLLLTHALPALIAMSFFFIVYRAVPVRQVRTLHVAIGALAATVLWEGAKLGFAYYVRNLARYAGFYGTLEAIIVLALWLELSVSIILYCGEVVALLSASSPRASESRALEPAMADATPAPKSGPGARS